MKQIDASAVIDFIDSGALWALRMTTRCSRFLHGAAALLIVAAPCTVAAQAARRPAPLAPADIEALARLLQLEDTRTFDSVTLARHLGAAHPEVRRRAALAVGRIRDLRGAEMLRSRPLDSDTALAATTVFAVAQLRDTASSGWLDSLLAAPTTPPAVATEAARGLGMLDLPAARAALAAYLLRADASARSRGTVREALLAIGRQRTRGDLAPVRRWAASPDEEVRWRAAWALLRPRDPAAVADLLALAADRSPVVRAWVVRGLDAPRADSAGLRSAALARLLAAVHDPDRGVKSRAAAALASYDEPAALSALREALESDDWWLSGFMVELGGRIPPGLVPMLRAAAEGQRPCVVRLGALRVSGGVDTAGAAAAALAVARDPVPDCRREAVARLAAHARVAGLAPEARGALGRLTSDSVLAVRRAAHAALLALGTPDTAARRAAFSRALAGEPAGDAVARGAVLAAFAATADTGDLARLLDAYERAQADTLQDVAVGVAEAVATLERRAGVGGAAFFARFAPPAQPQRRTAVEGRFPAMLRWPAPPPRPLEDYRRIVERWVVPNLAGRPRPRTRWETTRGVVELELYAGDAPLAADELVRLVEAGALVGTSFLRTVPVFVAQQERVPGSRQQREEINRHRLTRGNLSWATAGYDRGGPGYTLGVTPQPHNEGEFTALGRVVAGMAVVERLEVGDRIVAARMTRMR